MKTYILKANRIELTDNDTKEQSVIIGNFVPEFHFSTVDSITEVYIECPVINGQVVTPDYYMRYNHRLQGFE